MSLDAIPVSNPWLYRNDIWYRRLRREKPVHFHRESHYGLYGAVTKYKDIIQAEQLAPPADADPRLAAGRSVMAYSWSLPPAAVTRPLL